MFCFKCEMNEIANMFLLAEDKFMPGMHLKQPLKFLFIKMNLIKLVFSMIWLMANQKI